MALRRPAALVFALALAFTACGDDGDDDAGGSGSSSASGSASGPETTDDATDDTDGGGGDAEASDEFCAQADTLANDDSLDDMDVDDPDAVAVAMGLLDDWADEAPDDVATDIRTLVSTFEEMVTLFDDPDIVNDPEAMEQLEAITAEAEEASERVETFVLDACGIELDGGETDTDSDTDTTEDTDG
jgi:hypothetical protein